MNGCNLRFIHTFKFSIPSIFQKKNIHFILQKHLLHKERQNFTSLPKTFFPSGEKFFSN